MNTHIEATGGLVSNPRERETRGARERTAMSLSLEAATSSLADRYIDKRDKGRLSNRNLRDRSYLGNSSSLSTAENVPLTLLCHVT